MRVNPGPPQNLDWLYEVRNGRAFCGNTSVSSGVGTAGCCQLLNPAASGITISVYRLVGSILSTGPGFVQHFNTPLTALVMQGVNLQVGGPAGLGQIRAESVLGVPGVSMLRNEHVANSPFEEVGQWFATLDAGEGIVFCADIVAGTAASASYYWVER